MGTVMVQSCKLKKALINDRLQVSKVFWKFRISTIYNLAVTYLWNLPLSWKVAYFLSKTLQLINLKTRTVINAKISEIIYLLIYNLYDCTFNVICTKVLWKLENIIYFRKIYSNLIMCSIKSLCNSELKLEYFFLWHS